MFLLKHGGHVLDAAAKDAEKVAETGDVFLAQRVFVQGISLAGTKG